MTPQDRPKIEKGYTDNNGNYFNINNVIFPINNTPYYFGEFTASSHDGENVNFSDDEFGMQIYRSFENPNIGYKIYKNLLFWTDNFFCNDGVFDARLVAKLQEKQSKIKLTDFPTGVVTINNSVIGQEIPIYNNYTNLHSLSEFINGDNYLDKIEKLKTIYLNIVYSIEELLENDIIYSDIQRGNILFNKIDFANIKIIDFDYTYTKFKKTTLKDVHEISCLLAIIFDVINKDINMSYEFGEINESNSFNDMKQKIKNFK